MIRTMAGDQFCMIVQRRHGVWRLAWLGLLWPLAVAGCGRGDDGGYVAAGYRAAYSQCEYDAQVGAATQATLADRVQRRADLLRACLAGKGY
jgi:hypothetical protein